MGWADALNFKNNVPKAVASNGVDESRPGCGPLLLARAVGSLNDPGTALANIIVTAKV